MNYMQSIITSQELYGLYTMHPFSLGAQGQISFCFKRSVARSYQRKKRDEKQLSTGETAQGARNKEMDFRAPCTLHLGPARSTDQCRVNTNEIS
jgi:hypothetical protein